MPPGSPSVNHAYRVVDTATYAAVRDSRWIAEAFAPREQRTTNRPDWSYTGLYLYGRTTYLELFDQDAGQGAVGHAGLAFGVDAGQTSAIADAWRRSLGLVRTALVERPTDTGSVPWFHLACAEPDRAGGLHLWSMEYHVDFLTHWHADLTEATPCEAADVLDRYAARVTPTPREAFLLGDVTGLALTLAPAAWQFLARHLEPFGASATEPGRLDARLGVTEVVARSSPQPAGLHTVTCRLQRDTPRQTHRLGTSTLTLDGRTAVWVFGT